MPSHYRLRRHAFSGSGRSLPTWLLLLLLGFGLLAAQQREGARSSLRIRGSEAVVFRFIRWILPSDIKSAQSIHHRQHIGVSRHHLLPAHSNSTGGTRLGAAKWPSGHSAVPSGTDPNGTVTIGRPFPVRAREIPASQACQIHAHAHSLQPFRLWSSVALWPDLPCLSLARTVTRKNPRARPIRRKYDEIQVNHCLYNCLYGQ